jgi:histidine kinase
MPVPGYAVSDTIYRTERSLVYRARRESDDAPVVLKLLSDPYPQVRQVVRLRTEHEILRSLQFGGIPATHALVETPSTPVIVMQDTGGVSLDRLRVHGIDLRAFLELAVSLSEILAQVHRQRIVHKDITPGNVVWNRETGRVQIIDFGIATRLAGERPTLLNRKVVEGTLAYMSPEQTGRTNNAVDARSDLYSLGATLFHVLTGRVLFTAEDFMELIHCHLARRPPLAHELRPDVPPVVSSILDRLLAKAPDERYRSAYGVAGDFRRCLEALSEHAVISEFRIGLDDISERFTLPQRLYGREQETATLLSAYARASVGGAELLLVAGYSGIGKSALVRELHGSIVERRGLFGQGKCEQLERNVPYAALIRACQELIRSVLTETQERLSEWRVVLKDALGTNGAVVSGVIPEIEHVIGAQAGVPELPSAESENRFHLTFERFLRCFARTEHPLAIFLDDLQWIDVPSLKLLRRLLVDDESKHLLVIGAYRDNEVDALHPLALHVADMERDGATLATIELGALELADIAQLVVDALGGSPAEAAPIAEACLEKTHGNPFFLGRFLLDLHEDGVIYLDVERGRWGCDVEELGKRQVAENVVDLLAKTLDTLPLPTKAALRMAGCLGNTFDLGTLSLATARPPAALAGDLWPALQRGLLLPLDADYRFVEGMGGEASSLEGVRYRFLHDRVQQAAYQLIPAGERAGVHCEIGRLLLKRLSQEEVEQRLFEIVGHLNRGTELLAGPERFELAELNLRAGRKAMHSAAFEPALAVLSEGITLLGPSAWEERYPLCLSTHVQAASAAFRSSQFERSDELVQEVLNHARTVLDKVEVYEVRIFAGTVLNRTTDAILAGLEILGLLGIRFPSNPTKVHVGIELLATKRALLGKRIEDLALLPEMTDPAQLATMRIMGCLASTTYIGQPALFPLVILRQIGLMARWGVTASCAFALTTYGIIVNGVLGDSESAYRCGETAIRLLERLPAAELDCRVGFIHEVFIRPFRDPVDHAWEALPALYERGLETGDLEYAGWCRVKRLKLGLVSGRSLDELEAAAERTSGLLGKLGQEAAVLYAAIPWQTVQNLQGKVADPCRLVGDAYDEDQQLARHLEAQDVYALCALYFHKTMLCYHFGSYRDALASAESFRRRIDGYVSMPLIPVFFFYDALIRLALYPTAGVTERPQLLFKVRLARRKLRRWAASAPHNMRHRLLLVDAELARVRGKPVAAGEAYEGALEAARANRYLSDEALINELAARFYEGLGWKTQSEAYRKAAVRAYAQWGADAKVKLLGGQAPPARGTTKTRIPTATREYAATSEELDLASVLKSAQAISGEIRLEQLLHRLLRVLIENAGAERGLLVLQDERGPRVKAEALSEDEGVQVSAQSVPLGEAMSLSAGIVEYVLRTGESVVLADAARGGAFVHDPYVRRTRPRSILCAPIVGRGETRGAVYLVNNLASGSFTPDRLEVIGLLASQAAISLENAILYASLEARVAERTQELEDKNVELAAALNRLETMQDRIITQEKLASLGSLAAGIAHELKNPLNFVNNFAQLSGGLVSELSETLEPVLERLPDDARSLLPELLTDLELNASKIREHGQRADGIIQGMLAHSRRERGIPVPCDLNALLEQQLAILCQARADSLDVSVERDLDQNLISVEVVPRSLAQAIQNVLHNAWDALAARAVGETDFVPLVRVSSRAEGESVELRVRDNGAGISPGILTHVFEPFFTTKSPGDGIGLGLSIAHDIVNACHGGELLLESRVGEFTQVILRLPKASKSHLTSQRSPA